MRAMLTLFSIACFAAACTQQPAEAPPPAATPAPAVSAIDRGSYIVSAQGACDDCHTPMNMTDKGPVPDMTRRLSGYIAGGKIPPIPSNVLRPSPDGFFALVSNDPVAAWVGPWGVSYPRNLTPDVATGLGSWTEEMFIKTIREGKHQGEGRPLLPPMPWPVYRNMTDEDLKAIWAFLKTVPPINNAVPDPIPPEAMGK